MLPGGKDPQDIVLEVFSRVASGRRKLNTRFSYEVQLKAPFTPGLALEPSFYFALLQNPLFTSRRE
jgi:hypothetical protein